jgi:hypothetical protein
MLLLSLVLFGTSSYECILFRKDTADTSGDVVVDDCLVIFAENKDAEFLAKNEKNSSKRVETYDVAVWFWLIWVALCIETFVVNDWTPGYKAHSRALLCKGRSQVMKIPLELFKESSIANRHDE